MGIKNIHFALVFFFISVFTFFSCKEDTAIKKIKIGFSQAMTRDNWRQSMNDAMQLQASLNDNIELTIKDANYNVANQIKHISDMIAEDYDVIIVSPIQSKPITPIVKKALDKNIPVLVVDRKTENQNYTAYIGADNVEVGKNAAKQIMASNRKDTIRIIEIKGLNGSSPATERSLGFNIEIDRFKKAKVIAHIEGNWEKESIQTPLKQLLEKNKHIDYIFAHNDRMAYGAWEVAKTMGLEKAIKFIGVDGLNGPNGGIQHVLDGTFNATILYPTGGSEAIKLAVKMVHNEAVAKNNILSTTIINSLNAGIMKNQFDKINEQQINIEQQIVAIKKHKERYYVQNNLLLITSTLLILILSLAIYSVYSVFAIRKRNRQLELNNAKITIQRNQIEKIAKEIKQNNEDKQNFFTGLSHEFKTPITLILSAIESITESANIKGVKLMNEVELIYNNSRRLLRLINQLLDFRKIEDQKFKLRVSKTNLYAFSEKIFKDFKREAAKLNISFKLSSNNEALEVFIDRDLIDKVYFNLLSNAFKFTPRNGEICVKIIDHEPKNTVAIHFKDSGIGIPENEINQVFKAFFKGSNNRKNSSGIGLNLSHQFIEMHKGSIEVNSVHGAEFIITLLKGKAHFEASEIITEENLEDSTNIDFTSDLPATETYLNQTPENDKEKYSILIIEDNKDLSAFLKSKLQLEYDIYLSDGTNAIELALDLIPDVILSDINLPQKDGFEICNTLKHDLRTSHIPTILLTALGDKASYVKGLQAGADLYLTKPFSYAILIQSVKSLLYNREKLRYYYTTNIHKINDLAAFGTLEQKFVYQLNTIINDNLANSDFSVENLAESLSISRVQLYRKVKALLGLSISDYISNIRLEKAKLMLENNDLSISEVAYATGFSSPGYFATTFKNRFGSSPGSFRKSI